MSTPRPKKEVVVAIMGATGAGKSSFLSKFGGPNFAIGHDLKSETRDIMEWTGKYKGVTLTLLDTPGFGDKDMTDAEILEKIAVWLQDGFEQGKKINGIIYLHRITDNRLTNIDVTNIRMFRSLCGKEAMANAVLCTSFWDQVDPAVGEQREQQLRDEHWDGMIAMGATVERHTGSKRSAKAILDRILHRNGVVLQIQEEMGEGKTMEQTEAGQIINADILRMEKKFAAKVQKMQEAYEEALEERDEKMMKLVKADGEKMRKEIERLEEDKLRLEQDIKGLKDEAYRRPASGVLGKFVRWLDTLLN